MTREIWKDIPGYNGLYQVSNLGRVYSNYYNRLLTPELNKGYLRVSLSKDKKAKHYLIHRLVALAFIDNPMNLPYVNHKNEIATDNRADNLEWCDTAYNNNYGTRIIKAAKKKSIIVLQYDLDGNFIREWESAADASRKLNITSGKICAVCKGIRKSTNGYKWRYKL